MLVGYNPDNGRPIFTPTCPSLTQLSKGASPAVGDLLYYATETPAGMGDTRGVWQRLPIGTPGQVLTTETISGVDLPQWATQVSAAPEFYAFELNTTFTLSAASGTWEDVMTFTSPGAMSAYVTVELHCLYFTDTLGDYLQARVVNGSNVVQFGEVTFGTIQATGIFTRPSLFMANTTLVPSGTLKLQVRRVFGGTVTTSTVLGNGSVSSPTAVTFLPVTATVTTV